MWLPVLGISFPTHFSLIVAIPSFGAHLKSLLQLLPCWVVPAWVGFPVVYRMFSLQWETTEVWRLKASMYNLDLSTTHYPQWKSWDWSYRLAKTRQLKIELWLKFMSLDTRTKTLAMTLCFPLESCSRFINIYIIYRYTGICVLLEFRFLLSVPSHLAFSMHLVEFLVIGILKQ